GLPEGQDVRATVACLRSLGVTIAPSPISPSPLWGGQTKGPSPLRGGSGRGYKISPAPSAGGAGWGFATPHGPLDCANSGTTMRLLAGILAGNGVSAAAVGAASPPRRPTGRIIETLRILRAPIHPPDGGAPRARVGAPPQGPPHC